MEKSSLISSNKKQNDNIEVITEISMKLNCRQVSERESEGEGSNGDGE